MKRKEHPNPQPPEQKVVNELWQLLGANSNEQAVAGVKELIGAVQSAPLVLTLSIQRATGQVTTISNFGAQATEQDVALMRNALKALDDNLVQHLARMSKEQGKKEAAATPTPAG